MPKLPTLSLYSIDWDPKPKGVSIAQDCAKRIRKRENPHHVAESHKMSYDQMRHLLSTELDTNVSTLIGNAKPKNRRTMPEAVKNKKPG
jgi:hypothetical protein